MANRFPPSLHPSVHFKELKREVFGRVTQCRIGHCFVGDKVFQTCEHVLRECPLYEEQRHILKEVSRDVCLPGTKKGTEALAEFLDKSGAFTKTGKQRHQQELPVFDDEPDPEESDSESDDDG
ncbi:hypothetical protein DFH07DRAFT_962406 [Mycena maculata]|uniref:Uncharacterized protein n=1 Tax=Mycena maculata TaxID=230809 RepID=A0AAD7IS19_9AGAR|nr:hypothetical protein DFH07DRAFT_962406 [Mycena maculata]